MIDDENHPHMIAAQGDLTDRIAQLTARHEGVLSQRFLDEIEMLIADHRAFWRKRGIDFPRMKMLVLYRLGIMALIREDIEPQGLRNAVIKLARDNPTTTAEELAGAVREAFPHLRSIGRDFADEGAFVAAKDAARSTLQ